MISEEKWFMAKYGNTPSFTAAVRRQERHYGHECPVKIGWFRLTIEYVKAIPFKSLIWFRDNLCLIIGGLCGVGVVVVWASLFLLSFYLLPNAIEAELERQISVVQEQITGGRK